MAGVAPPHEHERSGAGDSVKPRDVRLRRTQEAVKGSGVGVPAQAGSQSTATSRADRSAPPLEGRGRLRPPLLMSADEIIQSDARALADPVLGDAEAAALCVSLLSADALEEVREEGTDDPPR